MGFFGPKNTSRILVVDDDFGVQKVVQDMMTYFGYETVSATGGYEALKVLEKEHPMLVILDIQMPDLNGLAVLQKIKSDPKTKDIPVLMLTSLQQVKDVEDAFAKGAAGYLTKPLDINRAEIKIKEILAKNPPKP
jgi:CheY-like chemotaxis protein